MICKLHSRQKKNPHGGFTLVELLVSIGIISVLSTVVIGAINIKKSVGSASDAQRRNNAKELTSAMYQTIIKEWQMVKGADIPEGIENAKPICRAGISSDPSCVNLGELVPEYVACIPYDTAETNSNYTGYLVYQKSGRPIITSGHMGEWSKGIGGCEISGPVGHWKLDETSGLIAYDSSGFGHDGTLENWNDPDYPWTNPQEMWTTDAAPYSDNPGSLNFHGANHRVHIPHADDLSPTNAISLTAWVKITTFESHSRIINKHCCNTHRSPYSLYNLTTGAGTSHTPNFELSLDGTQTVLTSNRQISAGQWEHIAATYNGEKMKIYINGDPSGERVASGLIKTGDMNETDMQDIYIGDNFRKVGPVPIESNPTRPDEDINGLIDDVRIYNRVLSRDEIQSIMTGSM